MKKIVFLGAVACVALVFTGCKSSESAYRKAYDKAQAQEQAYNANTTNTQPEPATTTTDTTVPVVAPLDQRPADQTQVVDNNDNVTVRHENVNYESGEPLKAFSVVVGSYSIKANADDLLARLQRAGYKATEASADINGTTYYRVISATADTKGDAVTSRNAIRGSLYNPKGDAWILAK